MAKPCLEMGLLLWGFMPDQAQKDVPHGEVFRGALKEGYETRCATPYL